ncbi:MAG: HD domain-containing protein [Gammaproteobacteria bacterium]|nr:HD domain-containing protein [Gammaproteobacteria bacterium]
MQKKIKVSNRELSVGEELAWSIYDDDGKLLLSEGQVIPDHEKLDSLSKHAIFRLIEVSNEDPNETSPFFRLNEIGKQLDKVFDQIESSDPQALEKIEQLTAELDTLCLTSPNAVLAAVHLPHTMSSSLAHALQCGILVNTLFAKQNLPDEERHQIMAAALTANIGMRGFYEAIQKQETPLSATQRRTIAQHPQKSAKMLHDIGVKNATWLKVILQHHELNDGSGYPSSLNKNQIVVGAKALAIAERYSMMISRHSKHDPISIGDALKIFFMEQGDKYEKALCMHLVLELTIFPPGSFVELANGDTAIVVRRNMEQAAHPVIKSIADPLGQLYEEPIDRDVTDKEFEIMKLCRFSHVSDIDLDGVWGYSS